MKGMKVLEIGLGYGTVSQRLAESGADYTGLDIAQGPVSMVNQRLTQNHLPGVAIKGSILEPQLPAANFDCVIAIGCLHHTGNLKLAIEQCHSLLKADGQLIFMVYYAYSYRRFRMTPILTIKNMVKEVFGYRGVVGNGSNRQRAAYDVSSKGLGAPHTDWISIKSLRKYCQIFTDFSPKLENIDQEKPYSFTKRQDLLKTKWPSLLGLDLYVTCTK
jgi:SAM-dependent methyltransferase